MVTPVVVCLAIGFAIGCCSLFRSLAVLVDFDTINGPLTLISETQYKSHNTHALRDVALRVVMRRKDAEVEVYFKAPLIFNSMSKGDKRYLLKRCMRLSDIRPGKILQIEASS